MNPARLAFARLAISPYRLSFNLRFAICILQFAILFVFAPQLAHAAGRRSQGTRVEVYRGEPFGIGRVTIDLAPGASAAPARDDRVTIVEEKDRVLYPVIENKASRRILRSFLGI